MTPHPTPLQAEKLLDSHRLIAADKVQGASVYSTEGEKLGTIDSVLIDKYTGTVAFVFLSSGGFLGIGEDFYPLPWAELHYDMRQDAYVIGMTQAQLQQAIDAKNAQAPSLVDTLLGHESYDRAKA